MATTTPRSASDATRFTATTPHASSKTGFRSGSSSARFAAPSISSRFSPPSSAAGAAAATRGGGSGGGTAGPEGETLDQKVARLRAAHLRAKASDYSRFDRVVEVGRRVCDALHRFTVMGLISFTVVGAVVTSYTVYDMIVLNRKRKREFFAMHRRLEAESVEAARIALMNGTATQEQIELIDDENERLANVGKKKRWFERAGLVVTPRPAMQLPPRQGVSEAATWPAAAQGAESKDNAGAQKKEEEVKDKWSWFRSRPVVDKQAETGSTGGLASAVEEKQAKAAIDKEKEKQHNGGPLDAIGLEPKNKPEKKSWW